MFSKHRSVKSSILGETFIQKDKQLILNYIKEQDVPEWYRGLSSFQMEAAQNLLSALRDDAEQNTAHRVLECLNLLGLNPMISARDVKFLMGLSRCNDLAFLWFLMDIHYKMVDYRYTLNEQIIMTSIAHLDMITTMRGLDQILPPAQPTKKELERGKRKSNLNKKTAYRSRMDLMRSKHRPKYKLPYFKMLPRPEPFGKPLTSVPQDHQLHFECYEDYANPTYVVQNEANRWYANYDMNPSKRVAEGVIKNELLCRWLGRINVNHIINRHMAVTFNRDSKSSSDMLRSDAERSLCDHHKVIDELEKSLEHELKVIARDKCLKYFDVVTKKKEATRKRIQEQMAHDVSLYMSHFKRLADSTRKSVSHMHLVTNDDVCKFDLNDGDKENACPSTKAKCYSNRDCRKHLAECDLVREKKRCREQLKPLNESQKMNTEQCGDGLPFASQHENCWKRVCPLRCCNECAHKIGDGPRDRAVRIQQIARGNTCDYGYPYIKEYDYGHSERHTSPSDSETFFHAPNEHRPYEFNYHKIFRFKDAEPEEEQQHVKRTCLQAVYDEMQVEPKKPLTSLNMDDAVKQCAKKIFKEQVEEWKKATEERERMRLKNKKTPLDYDQEYYDPDNKELMHQMLKDGLAYLAKDPKYVFASMPDCHKYPVLRLWMYRRFGKVFSREELDKAFRQSSRIFHSLYNMTLDVKLPSARPLGPALYIDYTCRDYILQKTKHLRDVYYRHLDAAIMDQSRALFLAISPYLCTAGPPRRTFFAYMPPRRMDIHHFHVWKPTEFMNAKAAHDLLVYRKSKKIIL